MGYTSDSSDTCFEQPDRIRRDDYERAVDFRLPSDRLPITVLRLPGHAVATITVATATMYAQIQVRAVAAQVQGLPAGAVTTAGNQNAMVQFLSNAVVALQNGNMTQASSW